MKDFETNWRKIKHSYRIGSIIQGRVTQHLPFGIFLDIGTDLAIGLVQITDFLDTGRMTQDQFPPINEEVTVKIIGYTEDNRFQIWCTMKPSEFQ